MATGLRMDPFAARAELRAAVADYAIPALGPPPNVFGETDKVLGFAEDQLQQYQDRYSIARATPLGWVSDVTGTGERVHLASRDTGFTAEPWELIPWVWPNDATVTINGVAVTADPSKHEELSWSQLTQQIRVDFDVTSGPIAQHPSDTVTVSIPGADWMVGYLDGVHRVRLDHVDGPSYYRYNSAVDRWQEVTVPRLIDAEVWADRPADARSSWVRFTSMQSSMDLQVMTGRRSPGVSAEVNLEIAVGSGPNQRSPEEADAIAYRIMHQVIEVLTGLPRLTDSSFVTVTGHNTVQSWGDPADGKNAAEETILGLQVSIQSR